jgi:hypothetical protein
VRAILDHLAAPFSTKSDIKQAVQAPTARLVVYDRGWGGAIAAIVVPTMDVVPVTPLGPHWHPWFGVSYSADDATIRTAYMFSRRETLDVPEDATWLT